MCEVSKEVPTQAILGLEGDVSRMGKFTEGLSLSRHRFLVLCIVAMTLSQFGAAGCGVKITPVVVARPSLRRVPIRLQLEESQARRRSAGARVRMVRGGKYTSQKGANPRSSLPRARVALSKCRGSL